ncbi:transposase [Streptomyces sp. NPDC006458]|uniref:IS701 family transposase n=1 Tax=Streptomyces sp. NPDC006458 TaxID=3154302 RepID=UPI0033B7A893
MPATDLLTPPGEAYEKVFEDVLDRALHSIPRRDQRYWGELYARSLLTVRGKKTIRALANGGGNAVEQSLYQFITKSPWTCGPVRREVARMLSDHLNPRAWVVQPLVITKIGQHSVGVERQWVPHLGRLVNCQQAVGVWMVSERGSAPVDWRLALPECWTDHPEQRRRASIPDHVGAAPPHQCALDSIERMTREWRLPDRPVVMDLTETDPYPVCAELNARRVPFVVRINPRSRWMSMETRRRPGDTQPGGARAAVVTLAHNCMPVEWYDAASDTVRATFVGASPVLVRRRTEPSTLVERQELVLMGAWNSRDRTTPGEFWLTNLPRAQFGTVYRTAMLAKSVERDMVEVSEPLGARDFAGRSFRGWHHHMTMVSVAHAVTALTRALYEHESAGLSRIAVPAA